VHRFTFAGNTLLSNDALLPIVAPFLDRPLDFNELQSAAIAVATAYRKAGWIVSVYLPQQDQLRSVARAGTCGRRSGGAAQAVAEQRHRGVFWARIALTRGQIFRAAGHGSTITAASAQSSA
jgi:POTRA domain, ShlB-type